MWNLSFSLLPCLPGLLWSCLCPRSHANLSSYLPMLTGELCSPWSHSNAEYHLVFCWFFSGSELPHCATSSGRTLSMITASCLLHLGSFLGASITMTRSGWQRFLDTLEQPLHPKGVREFFSQKQKLSFLSRNNTLGLKMSAMCTIFIGIFINQLFQLSYIVLAWDLDTQAIGTELANTFRMNNMFCLESFCFFNDCGFFFF